MKQFKEEGNSNQKEERENRYKKRRDDLSFDLLTSCKSVIEIKTKVLCETRLFLKEFQL
jgi:hypothetical protein